MSENKISEFESVEELVEYFDNNDMAECWDEMAPVHFDVNIQRRSSAGFCGQRVNEEVG